MIEYFVKYYDRFTDKYSYMSIYSNLFYEVGEKFIDDYGDENTVLAIGRNNWFA